MAEAKIAIIQTRARPLDPVIVELDQWLDHNRQVVNEVADATLAELHAAFDAASVERDRLAEVTQKAKGLRAKPKPTILDGEVALVHELADLVTVATRLHHATLDVEQDADVAAVGLMQTAREVERQHRRLQRGLPLPPPQVADDTEDYRFLRADQPDGAP